MNDILDRITKKRWVFAILAYAFNYLTVKLATYGRELDSIAYRSKRLLGADITHNLGFFEVLESAKWNFLPGWGLLTVGGTYLIIAMYFMDFKNEKNIGWKRIYLSAQILIPTFFALYIDFVAMAPPSGTPDEAGLHGLIANINIFFVYFGFAEAPVLIVIKTLTWIREGFSSNQK